MAPVRFGSVRLRFGDGTVRAGPVSGSGGSSREGVFVCFSTVSQRGRFRFRFRFLENGSGGSGSGFGSRKTVPTVPVILGRTGVVLTAGFLDGAGAETLIFVTGASPDNPYPLN